jgi:hypothetical protein
MELTAEHKKKVKKIVAKADKQTMTVKTVRRTLEKSLGLEKDALKPLKEELTAYVTLLIDPPTPAKEKPAKKAKPESSEDARIVQLKKMGQAVRAGPTLFKGLKDLDADAKAAELKERLVAKGYEIAGEAPTAKEIKEAKRKRDQMEEDDNGMDLSNIITGKRRRADVTYAPAPAPLEENNVDEVDDDEEAEFV